MTHTEIRTASAPNETRSILALVSTWVFALLPANLVPAIIGRLVADHGVEVTVASAVATGMTLANAVAVLVLRPLAARGHRKLIARCGALFLIVPLIIGALTLDATIIMAALVIGGIGSGAAVAASTAAVSATADPDRATNVVMIVNRFVVAAAFFLIPMIGGGLQSAILIIVVPGLIALIAAAWLPSAPTDTTDADGHTYDDVQVTATVRLFESFDERRVRVYSWALAIGFALWSVTDDGVFGLVEIFAADNVTGMESGTVTTLLGFAILCGLGGALIAMPLAKRIGRAPMLGIMLAASFVAKIGLMISTSEVIFAAANCVWGFAFGAMLPVVFGLAAQIRRNGSASVLVNGVYIFGVALGPLVSSQIYSATNATVLCIIMSIIAVIGAIPMIAIAKLSQRTIQEA